LQRDTTRRIVCPRILIDVSFLQPQILHHLEHFEDLSQVVLANGEAHSVVGSLDLNQGIQIPGQLSDDYSEVCVLGDIYSCEKRKRKKKKKKKKHVYCSRL
jgi:hypothetical protein